MAERGLDAELPERWSAVFVSPVEQMINADGSVEFKGIGMAIGTDDE